MIGKLVSHVKYGKGKIAKLEGKYITVAFEKLNENKLFLYPDAFSDFLVFENSNTQEKADADLVILGEKRKIEENEKRKLIEVHDKQRKNAKSELLKKRKEEKNKEEKNKAERERKRNLKIEEESV